MLQFVTTPLFDSPAQTLVNTVNTVGVMGKGIAAEFKRRYPEMFTRYRQFCLNGQLDIGKLYLYRTPNKWILNFPTKKHWRNPSQEEYIKAGLQKFVDTYTDVGINSIAFPQLGCGNGGLDWDVVRPVMESYLGHLPIPIYIHIATRRADFVPEHLSPAAATEAQKEREDVSFNRFWNDLVAAAEIGSIDVTRSEDGDMAPLTLQCNKRTITLPGEDLADLWNSLRMRGALPVDNFPGILHIEADAILKLLLKIDYIGFQQFVRSDSSGRRRYQKGIRFMPAAAVNPTPTIQVEV